MTDTKNITLGGKEYAIPELSLGQIKFVVPAVQRLADINLSKITQDNFDDLTLIAWLSVKKGGHEISRSDFENLPITFAELYAALMVISERAGMVNKKQSQGIEDDAGK